MSMYIERHIRTYISCGLGDRQTHNNQRATCMYGMYSIFGVQLFVAPHSKNSRPVHEVDIQSELGNTERQIKNII